MSGSKSEEISYALQVVRVSEGPGPRYLLDPQALAQVARGVQNRPVVVVSVAGSFRGGKSFLLGFFLRYLNASRADQLNGQWLGKEDEPLRGFNWRAGCERETTGIHLWSKPVIAKLDNGEEVAVLLMDTQGTFDTESTLQDSSTIFALSTLLSSVQIYNLFRNIQEDDLQHLHLFTDYGRLAAGDNTDGGKAFQVLQFLVRDWTNAHEYAYGANGGAGILEKRLEMKSGQKQELREVRQHIRSCFERIQCFLMPHPGLTVADAKFNGCLSDIGEQFRMGLLELVPSLLDPKNLTPKVIGGERVKLRDLHIYFQNYIDVFNSEELPPAVSILKGTATACLVAASRDAQDAYEARMEAAAHEPGSVAPDTVRARHRAALLAAEELFNGRRKLGSKEDADKHFDQLVKELEARLPLYVWQNEVKVRDAITAAKQAYEDEFHAVCPTERHLCLHPWDLEQLHERALSKSLAMFDSTRNLAEDEEDDERVGLLKQLTQQYGNSLAVNEQNNTMAVVEAREVYVSQMKNQLPYQAGTSTELLKEQHERAAAAAKQKFQSKRNRPTEQEEDEYLNKLLEEINEQFAEFEQLNLKSNKMAMQAAEYEYNNHVMSAWGPQGCCFHPRALTELHRVALDKALQNFQTNRIESLTDDYRDKLVQRLVSRLLELERINEYNNEQAVVAAFGEYTRRMDKHSSPSLASLLIGPFIVKLLLALPHHHERGTNEAIAEFRRRRRGDTYDDDHHLDTLKNKIEEAYENYKNPIQAIIRELGWPMP